MDKYQKIRESYKPRKFKILYIAESRPAQGTFFYFGNSNLYDAIFTAFEKTFKKEFENPKAFLEFFRNKLCYLDDLCEQPINKKSDELRERLSRNAIKGLSKRLRISTPEIVVILMKKIEPYIREAIGLSNIKPKHIFVTPFPAHCQKNIDNCVNENIKILKIAVRESIIK